MTYSGAIAGGMPNDPNQNIGSGSAIPGNTIGSGTEVPGTDVSDQGPGLIPETTEDPNVVPEDQRHLFESGNEQGTTPPPPSYVNTVTSPNGGLHHETYVTHDWERQDRLDMIAKLDAINHKLDHVLEHFHANDEYTASLGDGATLTFRKNSAG